MKYLFIDESGDPGVPFKIDKKGKKIPTGASFYYIVSILSIDEKQIFILEEEILKLKQKFGYTGEIKSTLISLSLYKAILKILVKHNIKIYFRIVNKFTYKGTFTVPKGSANYFHNVFDTYNVVKTIRILCLKEKLLNCEVVIDRAERRALDGAYNFDQFNTYLRSKVNSKTLRRVHHITHVDSLYVNIMQLSDLISGALRDHLRGKNKDLRKIVAKQLKKVY